MKQSKGILLAFVLLSGSLFAPTESFAQNNQNSDFFSALFDLIQQFFPSSEVEINTDSDSLEEFNEAVIVVTSSNTSTTPEYDESNDENIQDNDNNTPEFVNANIQFSNDTSLGNDTKVTLCHVTPENPSKPLTITVGNSAVAAHLAHGDYLGECINSSPAETSVQEFENATVEMSSDTSVDSKITLCHVPPGNPSKAHTITISSSAVESHIAHGDYLGECSITDSSVSDKKPKDKENKNKANGKNKD